MKQGTIDILRAGSSRSKERYLSSKRALVRRNSGACFSNCELSNKLSMLDWRQSAVTSGTPETRPDALEHKKMLVLAQGIEP